MTGELLSSRSIFLSVGLVFATLVGACAPSSPAEDASTTDSSSRKGRKGQVAPLPPLEQVPSPDSVVVRFRITSPAQLADGLFEAMSVPFDWRKAVEKGAETLGQIAAVDWSAAVEGAVVLNPDDPMNPDRFVSVGVQGVDAVLLQLEKENIAVQEGPGGVMYFSLEDEPCAVGRSLGASAARVVCSDQERSLMHMLDYALRGLPAEKLLEADAFVEVDARPVRSRYGKELQRGQLLASVGARQLHVGHPKFDRALTDAAIGLAEEAGKIVHDFHVFRVLLDEEDGDFQLSMQLAFDGQDSFAVRTLSELASTQGPAPELFRVLPSTASSASYNREVSKEHSAGWMSVLSDLLTGAAEYKGASPEMSRRLASFLAGLGPMGSERVMASGPLVQNRTQGDVAVQSAWMLWGSEQSRAEVVQVWDDLAWLLASREWRKMFPKLEEFELPQLSRVARTVPGVPGATVFEWSFPESLKKRAAELDDSADRPIADLKLEEAFDELATGTIVVFASDGYTWTSVATKGQQGSAQAAYQALAAEGADKLGALEQRGPVLDADSVAAGYFTLAGLGGAFWSLLPPTIAGQFPALLRATPGQGKTPIETRFWIEKKGGTTAHWSLELPQEFTRDAATLGVLIGTEMDSESSD